MFMLLSHTLLLNLVVAHSEQRDQKSCYTIYRCDDQTLESVNNSCINLQYEVHSKHSIVLHQPANARGGLNGFSWNFIVCCCFNRAEMEFVKAFKLVGDMVEPSMTPGGDGSGLMVA